MHYFKTSMAKTKFSHNKPLLYYFNKTWSNKTNNIYSEITIYY